MQQIAVQHRVGQFQNFAKRGFIRVAILLVAFVEVTNEQLVEFAHASPALPPESGFFGHENKYRRSAPQRAKQCCSRQAAEDIGRWGGLLR